MRLALSLCIPLFFAVPVASAGIDLTWSGCSGEGGLSAIDFTCDDPGFQAHLVGSFNLPAAVDSFFALDATIDVYSQVGGLPAFWNFTAGGGCNATGLTRQLARPAGCTAAINVWGVNGSEGNSTYSYTTPFGGSQKRARLEASFFRATTIDLASGTAYFGFSFLVSTANATDAGGTCAGCPSPVAFVWNSARFISDTRPTLEVTTPGPLGLCARANGAETASCEAVPAQRRTWGALKALYR